MSGSSPLDSPRIGTLETDQLLAEQLQDALEIGFNPFELSPCVELDMDEMKEDAPSRRRAARDAAETSRSDAVRVASDDPLSPTQRDGTTPGVLDHAPVT